MLKQVFLRIVQFLFGKRTETKGKDIDRNVKYNNEYTEMGDINFSAIFSNKIANYIMADSSMEITGENARQDLLQKIGQSMWRKMKKITAMSLGSGGIVIVPYVAKGKLYYNLVTQDRLTIDKTDGELITGATILAERKDIQTGLGLTKTYIRWTNYDVSDLGVLTITQKYTDETGAVIPTPEFWQNINEVMSISGVDRVPFGFIKSSISNRRTNDLYGVPITYGCDEIIKEIKETYKQIQKEYEQKKTRVFVDETMIDDKGKWSADIFTPIDAGTGSKDSAFYELYDPAFRPYTERLQELFARLEKAVGTSRGILTEIETTDATATAIKKAMFDTWTIVDDMRTNIEKGLEDFFVSCNVLANAYNLTPNGEYQIEYDWSNNLLEDTTEQFNQLTVALDKGIYSKAELRNWLVPSETMEESEKAVKEIEDTEPTLDRLLGTENTLNNQNSNEEDDENNKNDEDKKERKVS